MSHDNPFNCQMPLILYNKVLKDVTDTDDLAPRFARHLVLLVIFVLYWTQSILHFAGSFALSEVDFLDPRFPPDSPSQKVSSTVWWIAPVFTTTPLCPNLSKLLKMDTNTIVINKTARNTWLQFCGDTWQHQSAARYKPPWQTTENIRSREEW